MLQVGIRFDDLVFNFLLDVSSLLMFVFFPRGLIFSPPSWIITITANERTSSSWNASGQLNLPRPTTKKDLLLYTGKMAVVWRLLRSGQPTTHPTPVRTVLRANSASNLHRIGNGTRGPGVEAGFRGEKSSVLRLRCASIRFWVDDGDLFFDCVCVVLYRCVCHLSFLLLLDLHCKAIAPRVAEIRCYCSLLTFFSLRLCSLMVALSLFLFLKFDGLSGPLFLLVSL